VKDSLIKDVFKVLDVNDKLSRLSKAFKRHEFVIVRDIDKYFVATAEDLLPKLLN
jgi:hypothetical protein